MLLSKTPVYLTHNNTIRALSPDSWQSRVPDVISQRNTISADKEQDVFLAPLRIEIMARGWRQQFIIISGETETQ